MIDAGYGKWVHCQQHNIVWKMINTVVPFEEAEEAEEAVIILARGLSTRVQEYRTNTLTHSGELKEAAEQARPKLSQTEMVEVIKSHMGGYDTVKISG